ncbi:hypothetical protein M569_12966 [Genlisea aurea]|uniref:Auxin efflux carrier family protein n=1 Tax=Genlisea aurea TaxID=192259 RepID=S8DPW3_9LAMI|nr:hypothetical protein M569_12966 [Genlisea aurea]
MKHKGIRKAEVSLGTVLSIIVVRYVIQPVVGIAVVSGASRLGFLPSDPLFSFILMLQYTLPPANNISTMTQLYGVAEAECAVLIMWSYVVAAFAMTSWSAVFMSILT